MPQNSRKRSATSAPSTSTPPPEQRRRTTGTQPAHGSFGKSIQTLAHASFGKSLQALTKLLTPQAVRSLVQGADCAPPCMPLVVRLLDLNRCGAGAAESSSSSTSASAKFLEATVSDGQRTVRARLRADDELDARSNYTVSVKGFFASAGADPNIYLSDLDVLAISRRPTSAPKRGSSERGRHWSSTGDDNKQSPTDDSSHSSRIRGGMAGTFLAEIAPHLSEAELAGIGFEGSGHTVSSNNAGCGTSSDSVAYGMKRVDELFARHAAMLTLHSSSSTPSAAASGTSVSESAEGSTPRTRSNNPVTDGGTSIAAEVYLSALRDFNVSQIDRQKAGLASNVGRADATNAALLSERHRSALDAALQHAENTKEPLSLDLLCLWHSILCGGGLHPEAGLFRTKTVRAGRTVFTPPEKLTTELKKVMDGLGALEERTVTSKVLPMGVGPNASASSSLGPLLYAAAALFGVVDVHPFADGNGRLARIVANWALRRAGLPFPVNFLATPAQRREYVSAIQATRSGTNLIYRGMEETPTPAEKEGGDKGKVDGTNGVSSSVSSARLEALRTTGCLAPLVNLITDRIARAYNELRRSEAEKANLASEEVEARAARRAREVAASGDCIICFCELPNIATLCCGKAVHLNCIAEWLGSNESCPQCRAKMPRLPSRAPPPQVRGAEEDSSDDTVDFDTSESTTDDTSTDDTTASDEADNTEMMEDIGTTEDDTTTADDTTTDVHEAETASAGHEADTTTDTTSDTSTSTNHSASATHGSNRGGHALHDRCCAYCGNQRAVDCTNGSCGRCCVLYGNLSCSRHNVY